MAVEDIFLLMQVLSSIVVTCSNWEKNVKWVMLGLASCTHFFLQEILMKR